MTLSRCDEIFSSVAGSYCTASGCLVVSSAAASVRGLELFISAEIEKSPSVERRVVVCCAGFAGVLGAGCAGADCGAAVGAGAGEPDGVVAGALGALAAADGALVVADPTAEAAGALAAELAAVETMFWDDACAGVMV